MFFKFLLIVISSVMAPGIGFSQSSNNTDTCPMHDSPQLVQPESSRTKAQVRIDDVKFEGANKLPISEQREIARDVIGRVEDSAEPWLREMEKRVAAGWQHQGFFKVQVRADDPDLRSDETDVKHVALTFHIDEGEQYRSGTINFFNYKQFDAEQMSSMFPIAVGEIFDAKKFGVGLTALRTAYADIGYINFTVVPEMIVDDQNLRVSVNLNIDEGPRFQFTGVEVRGPDQELIHNLLHKYKVEPGTLFSQHQLDDLAKEANLLAEDDIELVLDEKNMGLCLIIAPQQSDPQHSR